MARVATGVIELRPVESETDVERFLAVRNAIERDFPLAPEALLAARRQPRRLDLTAFVGGEPIGAASAGLQSDFPGGRLVSGSVRVREGFRRRGIGTALFAAVSRHARADECTSFETVVRESDRDSLDFFGKRRHEVVLRAEQIALGVQSTDLDEVAVEGVELRSLADGTLDELLYDAALEIEPDLPGSDVAVRRYGEWYDVQLRPAVRECSFAALAHGVVVGYALVCERDGPVAYHGLTGVRREWRGRGIAGALKVSEIRAAKALGLRELRTSNEVNNAPIRRLNERLGYRPVLTWLHLRGPLLGDSHDAVSP